MTANQGAFASHVEVAPNRYRERYGLDFEDFVAGQRFKHRPGLTLSQQDNYEEAADTLNQAMLHFDHAYAGKTEFKRPLMVSTLTIQRLIGMTWKTFARRRRILGWADLSMLRPVYGGDTLYAETLVKQVHAASPDPDCGRLTLVTEGSNQDSETVCRMTYDVLVWRRGRAPLAELGY